MLDRLPSNAIPWTLLAASAATIGGALFFEHVLGYIPCALCLDGRQPHYYAMGAALFAGILSRNTNIGVLVLFFLALCAVLYLWGAGISFHHMGVEYGWWPGPEDCATAGGNIAGSLQDLQAALDRGVKPPRCDEAAWTLFGISLAGFNLVITLALAALAALPLWRYFRESRGEA